MIEPITRKQAIKALLALEDKAFGHDKGSGEMYQEFCELMGLCEEWDGESETKEENWAPGFWELLMAIGVKPQEIVDIGGINNLCFPPEMCQAYGTEVPHPYDPEKGRG